MSQRNVEIVRSGFAAWNAGDMETLRDSLDPDVVQRNPEGWPEPGPLIGREAVMSNWVQARELFDSDTVDLIDDLIEAGDRVVVRTTWRGTGRGPETQVTWTVVYTVRQGRISFWDHAEALEAAGLSE